MTARIPAIDVLKAAAIVTVVWIHTFPATVAPQPLVGHLHFLARFAVPGFFVASGMLAGRAGPRPWRRLLRERLPRIVGPYLVASVLALWYRDAVLAVPVPIGDALVRIIGGDAFGPYYFVPVLVGATIALEPLLRRPWLLGPVAVLFLGAGLASDAFVIGFEWRTADPFYWGLRNPLRWWGYAFGGAWLGMRWNRIAGGAPWWGGLVLLVPASLWMAWAWGGLFAEHAASTVAQWVSLWGTILGILLVSARWRDRSMIRIVSESSYPVYLYHLFVVYEAWELMHRTAWRSFGVWWLAIVLPLAGALLVRRVAGTRARYMVG